MKRFRNILVVTSGKDGGVAAVGQAAMLAKQSSAKITLVDTIPPLSDLLNVPGTEPAEKYASFKKRRLAELNRLADMLKHQGFSVAHQLLEGDSAAKTIELVISQGHDLVIKSADQPTGLAQRMFGTLGQRLFRKCPCPVWIIKVESAPRLERILVAVDPFPVHKDRNPMNVAIMEMATSLARLNDSDLHIVYVWPKWTQWTADSLHLRDPSVSLHAQNECTTLQKATLEKLVGPFRGGPFRGGPFRDTGHTFETHLLQGDAGDVVARLSHELDADLVIMGTVTHTNIMLFSIGNTAEHILDHVDCSVLAVKPVEFLPALFPKSVQSQVGFSVG